MVGDSGGFGIGSTERGSTRATDPYLHDAICRNGQLDTYISRLAIALVDRGTYVPLTPVDEPAKLGDKGVYLYMRVR